MLPFILPFRELTKSGRQGKDWQEGKEGAIEAHIGLQSALKCGFMDQQATPLTRLHKPLRGSAVSAVHQAPLPGPLTMPNDHSICMLAVLYRDALKLPESCTIQFKILS